MSVLTGKELRIVGFLCNWCSYGGADTAGVARFTQPTDLRIIRVPCSGRVNPLFPLKALLSGADGVLVSGCHPRDCHYSEGNYYARRRLETLKEFLPIIGIDPRRFEYTWVSASEGQRWQAVVTAFTERVHKLGPAPKFEDAKPMYVMPNLDLPAPLRPLGCGVNPAAMTELKDQIKAALEAKEVEFVMGWQKGFDGLHATPLYMRKPEDVEKLIWGPLNVHSLATYLPLFKGKKVGIVVKGCDSRGVVELLQENLINREDVVVFGMGCNGTIDINRVLAKIGDVTEVESVTGSGATLKVRADGKDYEFAMQDVAQDKCRACTVPNAVIHDHFAGSPTNHPGRRAARHARHHDLPRRPEPRGPAWASGGATSTAASAAMPAATPAPCACAATTAWRTAANRIGSRRKTAPRRRCSSSSSTRCTSPDAAPAAANATAPARWASRSEPSSSRWAAS